MNDSSYMRQLCAELEEFGIHDYQIIRGGKHFKCKFMHGGRKHMVVVSRSPSDRLAVQQRRATLRRITQGEHK